jgi:hypothetical protein
MNQEPEDELFRDLRKLPRANVTAPERAERAARTAFVRAGADRGWASRFFPAVGRACVPVALASVVGLYLFWAFATAIALVQ